MLWFTKIRNFWILWLWFTLCRGQLVHVTDIKCHVVDETLVRITKCVTNHISKTISENTINVTLLQEVKTAAIKLQFRKNSNGNYNPYFFSDTVFEGCKFIDNRSVSPIARYIFSIIEDFSNLNHSCPYKDYILVDRFRVDMRKFKWLPLPPGEYYLNSIWRVNGLEQFELGVYFTFTE